MVENPRRPDEYAPCNLIMGAAGAGKTSSLATYGKAGIETFVLFTEPRGAESLIDACERLKVPLDLFHWHTVTAPPAGWEALIEMSRQIRLLSFEQLSSNKSGIRKQDMKQLEALFYAIADFPDDRTGKRFGDATTWDDSRAFVIDSLSGLNQLAWLTTVGYKPTAHEGEWGMAMNLEEQLLHKLTCDCKCFFTAIGHIDREPDQITGASRVTVALLGRKLAPKVSRMFSDVVLATRKSSGFNWSTVDDQAELKNRSLPVSQTIEATFEPIVASHRRRQELLKANAAKPLAD